MDYQKDDKTRIGGFNNAPSPDDGGSHQDIYQQAAPSPNPYWQGPPKEDPYRPAPTAAPEPYQPPAPAAFDPYRPPPAAPEPYQPAPAAFEPYRPPPAAPEPYQPAPAAPEPYRPPSAAPEPYRPAPPVTPEPYRPAPSTLVPRRQAPAAPDPYQPAQPAPDLYRLSSQQDDMWFVVDIPGRPLEYPLRHGESVSVGRDATQNISIENKTLSRNHLLMQRNGDRITVQVMGLNGLVYANQVYKSTTIEVAVPATLTIGDVLCRIKKKYDSDATILMSDPAAAARQRPGAGSLPNDGSFASRPPSPSYSPQPSSPAQPFSGNPPFGGFAETGKSPFPECQPIPPVFPAGQPASGFSDAPYSPPSFEFGSNPSSGGSRDGMSNESIYANDGEGKAKGSKNLLLFGGAGVGILVLATCLFFWLRSPAKVEEGGKEAGQSTATKAPAAVPAPSPPEQATTQPKTNNLYAQYLSKAKRYIEEGNTKDACDYLKDIPPTSAYRTEAVELAKQISDCKLE